MSGRPLVSVVVPVRDGERYLEAALRSIVAQEVPLEVLVVDDGSRDGSAAVASAIGPPVRVLAQAPSGPGAARNRGVEAAAAACLAFLDADDLWLPRTLLRRLERLERDGLDAVFGLVEQFVSPELPPAVRAALHCPTDASAGPHVGTMLVRRASFDRVGPFSTAPGEFADWFLRARETGLRHALLPEVVLRRRLHDRNLGVAARDGTRAGLLHAVAAATRRRRQASEG